MSIQTNFDVTNGALAPFAKTTLVCGPMFAGKSTRLVELYQSYLACYTEPQVLVWKPALDTRYQGAKHVTTHDRVSIPCQYLTEDCLENWSIFAQNTMGKAVVLLVDEVQFFTQKIIENIIESQRHYPNLKVVFAGLDRDFKQTWFPVSAYLYSCVDCVEHLFATCASCGKPAAYSQRVAKDTQNIILVGGAEAYQPKCTDCVVL
jgi:thymidine kinase